MTQRIDASWETLFRQAKYTSEEYLQAGIDAIDTRLGAGYAKAHPALVGVFMQTAALDWLTSSVAVKLQELGDALREVGEAVAAAGDRDNQGER